MRASRFCLSPDAARSCVVRHARAVVSWTNSLRCPSRSCCDKLVVNGASSAPRARLPIPGDFMDTLRAAISSECNQGIYQRCSSATTPSRRYAYGIVVPWGTRNMTSTRTPSTGCRQPLVYYHAAVLSRPEDYGEPEVTRSASARPLPRGLFRKSKVDEDAPPAVSYPAGSAPACREVSLVLNLATNADGVEDP